MPVLMFRPRPLFDGGRHGVCLEHPLVQSICQEVRRQTRVRLLPLKQSQVQPLRINETREWKMGQEPGLWNGARAQSQLDKQPIRTFLEERSTPWTIQLTKETIEEKVFSSGVLDPAEYVKLGLIDGLRTYDQEISKPRFIKSKSILPCLWRRSILLPNLGKSV